MSEILTILQVEQIHHRIVQSPSPKKESWWEGKLKKKKGFTITKDGEVVAF